MKTLVTIAIASLALTVASSAKPLSKYSVPLNMTPQAHSNQVAAAARAEAVANWRAANPGSQIGLVPALSKGRYHRPGSPALRGFRG